MIGESKRTRQSDRWTPRQDPREPTINLSEDGTFRLCPQAKNLGPSVLSSLSAGTKKLATCCTKHVEILPTLNTKARKLFESMESGNFCTAKLHDLSVVY